MSLYDLPGDVAAETEYLARFGSAPLEVERELWRIARGQGPNGTMQTSRQQGRLLTLLARITRAHLALEIGTFSGYSAICIAKGLAPGGRVITCEIEPRYAQSAIDVWSRFGFDTMIECRVGPAIDIIRAMPSDQILDMVFIDADKGGYLKYFRDTTPRLRVGGLLVADNVLWKGRVVKKDLSDPVAVLMSDFNSAIESDHRFDATILPIGDGLLVATRIR